MKYLTVREISKLMSKSEETIKRWIRAGKFPNAIKENDASGWRVPESDIIQASSPPYSQNDFVEETTKDLVSLAYIATTRCNPTPEIINLLTSVGLKRTLEILVVMSQSPKPVKNPVGFIRRAIEERWTPNTLPSKIDRKRIRIEKENSIKGDFPFYNWLEE